MNIGEVIKKLRKEKEVTQDKLADYLGISYQAVSKWENGAALPDITLIAPLASYFGVSADVLFSINKEKNDQKTAEYRVEYQFQSNKGETQACIDLMREALSEYPRNYDFMSNLAHSLFMQKCAKGISDEDRNEMIKICERLLEDCTDDSIRHSAIQTLCFTYPEMGKKEEAVELALKMPTFFVCSDMLLADIYEGEEQIRTIQSNVMNLVNIICGKLSSLSKQNDLTNEERIMCIESSIKIYETVFYDGNVLFYHCRLARNYYNLAVLHVSSATDKAIEYLLKAEKHAAAYDELEKQGDQWPYTSLFVNKLWYTPYGTEKNWVGTERGSLLERLDYKCFMPLSEREDFTGLKKRLVKKND